MDKRLYKTNDGAMLAGVCAGLAEYFNVDVTLIRLVLVIAVFAGGSGLLAYIIAAIILPDKHQVVGYGSRPTRGSGETYTPETREEQPTYDDEDVDARSQAETGTAQKQSDFQDPASERQPAQGTQSKGSNNSQAVLALVLIALGGYLFVNRFFPLRFIAYLGWPVILVIIGLVLLLTNRN